MTAMVRIALRRPYTFVVLALLLLIIGPLAALRTPVDIFPEIRIPVIAAIWQYTGLPPAEMAGRMVTQFRARADHDRQRHRAYRSQLLHRRRHRQNLLPAGRRHPHRQRAGHRDLANVAASRCRPARVPPLILNYNASTVPIIQLALVRQGPAGADAVRPRAELRARAHRHRAGRRHALPVRRQVPPGSDRRQPGSDARARPLRPGRRQRAGRAEPDHAGRHREDRQLRIRDQSQQRRAADQDDRRSADQDRQRRDGLHPRRRSGARRQPAAAEHRSRRRQPLGADVRAQEWRGVDARDHRRRQEKSAGDEKNPAEQSGAHGDRRSVDLHQCRDRRRHPRRRHRGGADQPDDPACSSAASARR